MNKVDEIRHIQQMIVDRKWVDDKAVADEIDARVFSIDEDMKQSANT